MAQTFVTRPLKQALVQNSQQGSLTETRLAERCVCRRRLCSPKRYEIRANMLNLLILCRNTRNVKAALVFLSQPSVGLQSANSRSAMRNIKHKIDLYTLISILVERCTTNRPPNSRWLAVWGETNQPTRTMGFESRSFCSLQAVIQMFAWDCPIRRKKHRDRKRLIVCKVKRTTAAIRTQGLELRPLFRYNRAVARRWWQNGTGGCNQKHFQLLGSSASSSSGCYVANERLQ